MKRRNSYVDKKLLASRNSLKFVSANSQYVDLLNDQTFSFGTSNFCISIVAKRISGSSIILQIQDVNDAVNGGIQFYIDATNIYFQYKGSDSTGGNTIVCNYYSSELTRFTLIRRGNLLEGWVNNKLVNSHNISGLIFNYGTLNKFRIGRGGGIDVSPYYFNGVCSNLIIVNNSPTIKQFEEFHNTNIIPTALHPFVIAHYPLNQNTGLKAWDVVEQYNYAKTIGLKDKNFQSGDIIPYGIPPDLTITFGSDTDGNYANIAVGTLTASNYSYYYQSTAIGVGQLFKFKIKIKRIGGSGTLRLESYGRSNVVTDFNLSELPLNTLVTKEFFFTSDVATTQPTFLIGLSSGGGNNDSYNIYSIDVSSLLFANNGDLINYTNNEVGITNRSSKTAWENIYTKLPDRNGGIYGFRNTDFVGYKAAKVNKGATIPLLTQDNIIFEGEFIIRTTTNDAYGGRTCLFSTYTGAGWQTSSRGYFLYVQGQNVVSPLRIELFIRWSDSEHKILTATSGDIQYHKVNKIKLEKTGLNESDFKITLNGIVYIMTYQSGTVGAIPSGLSIDITQDMGIGTIFSGNDGNNDNALGNVTHMNGLFKINGTTIFQYDADENEIGQETFQDLSGNGRNVYLVKNLTTTTPKTITLDKQGYPEIRKALRLRGSLSQEVRIANFAPSNELGHTCIVGIKNYDDIDQAVPPAMTMFGIKDTNNESRLIYWWFYANNAKWGDSLNANQFYDQGVFVYRTDKISWFAHYVSQTKWDSYFDQIKVSTGNNAYGMATFQSAYSTGYIGFAPDNGARANAAYIHVSFYKGKLTEAQIKDVMNNSMGNNLSNNLMTNCQLYLNFEEIINDAGTYKLKDWSPQNRTVTLHNFAANEIDSAQPETYKLLDVDKLRTVPITTDSAWYWSIDNARSFTIDNNNTSIY